MSTSFFARFCNFNCFFPCSYAKICKSIKENELLGCCGLIVSYALQPSRIKQRMRADQISAAMDRQIGQSEQVYPHAFFKKKMEYCYLLRSSARQSVTMNRSLLSTLNF